jgi:CHASE2 domain-containing sensor protein
MRVSTLIRWFWRLALTGLSVYGILALWPPTYWPWQWMDFFQKAETPCTPDTNIVIVDVGQLSRQQIALLLQKIAAQKPRVIAMDVYFSHRQDSIQDSLLRETLCQVAALIPLYLPTDMGDAANPQNQPPQSVSDTFFTSCPRKAFANLLYREHLGGRIIRYTRLYYASPSGFEPSLAWAAAQHLDSTLAPSTLPQPILPIRYRGNIACFYFLSGKDLLADTLRPLIFSQKAVFVGLADPLYQHTEDLFFTPLGIRPFTHTAPDMYGVLIHANITSMLLHHTFWKKLPPALTYLLGGLGFILLGILTDIRYSYAYLWVRLTQIFLLLILGALFAYLAYQGYWVEAEVSFLILLLGGEICLLTAPKRKPALA